MNIEELLNSKINGEYIIFYNLKNIMLALDILDIEYYYYGSYILISESSSEKYINMVNEYNIKCNNNTNINAIGSLYGFRTIK